MKLTLEEEMRYIEARRRIGPEPGPKLGAIFAYLERLNEEAGVPVDGSESHDFPTNERSGDVESNRQRGRHMSVHPGREADLPSGPGLDEDDDIPF